MVDSNVNISSHPAATNDTPEQASLLSMRVLCRYFNDVQIVLGGMVVMIVACMMFVGKPEGPSGLPLFMWAVFLMYSIGYPIGHTAVSLCFFFNCFRHSTSTCGQVPQISGLLGSYTADC